MINNLRALFIHILGGYTDVDDALLHVSKSERERILTLATARLFNTIGPDDILHSTQEGFRFRGKLIQEEEMRGLHEEAKVLLQTKLWQVLRDDIRFEANKKMFLASTDVIDLTAGKLYLYALDAISKRLKQIAAD